MTKVVPIGETEKVDDSKANWMELPDAHLILRVATQRDHKSFSELVRRHQVDAFNLSRNIIGDPGTAEDAVQESILRIWRYAYTYNGQENARSWILKIVARESLSKLDALKKEKIRQTDALPYIRSAGETQPPPNLEKCEATRVLAKAMRALDPGERRLIALYYGTHLSQDDMSRTLGIPQRTISRGLKRTLAKLRLSLEAAGLASVRLDPGMLAKAILSGPAPVGLAARISESLKELCEAPPSFEQVVTAGKKSGWSWSSPVLAVSLVLCCAAGVWMTQSAGDTTPAVEKPAPNTKPVVFTAVQREASPRLVGRWNFGAKDDLKLFTRIKGTLGWDAQNGKREPGCLSISSTRGFFVAKFNVSPETLPFRMKLKYRSLVHKQMGTIKFEVLFAWSEVQRRAFVSPFPILKLKTEGHWVSLDILVARKTIKTLADGQVVKQTYAVRKPGSDFYMYGWCPNLSLLIDDIELWQETEASCAGFEQFEQTVEDRFAQRNSSSIATLPTYLPGCADLNLSVNYEIWNNRRLKESR